MNYVAGHQSALLQRRCSNGAGAARAGGSGTDRSVSQSRRPSTIAVNPPIPPFIPCLPTHHLPQLYPGPCSLSNGATLHQYLKLVRCGGATRETLDPGRWTHTYNLTEQKNESFHWVAGGGGSPIDNCSQRLTGRALAVLAVPAALLPLALAFGLRRGIHRSHRGRAGWGRNSKSDCDSATL